MQSFSCFVHVFLDSSNREINEEKADDENVDEGELEVESDPKEMQKKPRGRRKPKGKKRLPEEGKTDIGVDTNA